MSQGAWRIDRKLQSTTLNASGAASGVNAGQIRNDNPTKLLIIIQLSLITSPTSSGCTCQVAPPIGLVDTSYFAGTGDTAPGFYFLFPGDYLTLSWSGGPANGQGIATYVFIEVDL